ncbi:hypothetical protein [uncultured Alteromonas sp.]|uniref:hypothetical protein n=1 Tax=uncultured Alteromonas sp. TaxID=179113 RepID=UPI0030CDD5E9|tara:strand:- start:14364 stop:16316 length:1953 start_codon:yes stop_codon:yes gene_type:complete
MEHSKTLRALVVAPTPTWPLNYGNRKRIFSVCSKLQSLGFEIHYVHYASEGDWRDYTPVETRKKMNEQWDIVDHIWPSKPLHDWPKEGDDHQIDEWWDWALENHLSKTFSAREYDVCIVNYTWLSKALELAPDKTYKVLDTHDKFSGRRELLASQGIGKEFFHTTEDQELTALDRADLVWAIKEEEEIDFKNMGTKAKVSTLLHIDDRRESSLPSFENGVKLGFIGANNNINRVNILRFIERATPIFKKYCAPLTIEIAGSICNEIEVQDNPFFKTVGYVDSIDEFYDGIHAAIIPMEFSTGLKIKVAEALSQTKPMFSHQHAMEGFTPCHEFHELISFEEMALAMTDCAYDASELTFLTDASAKAHSVTEQQIWDELIELKADIVKKKQVFVLIPEEYGMKNKLAHYIAQAKIDLCNWNFKEASYFIIGKPSEGRSHSSFIRFVEDNELEKIIGNQKPATILNLCESFPDINIGPHTLVVSLVPIQSKSIANHLTYRSYNSVVEELYFPSLGHIHVDVKATKLKIDECWIIGHSKDSISQQYISLVAGSNKIRRIDIATLQDIDNLFAITSGLPKVIINSKGDSELSYSEQIMLEIAEKYDVEIRNLTHNQLLFLKRNNEKGSYDNQFFPTWEKFIQSNLAHCSQDFQF